MLFGKPQNGPYSRESTDIERKCVLSYFAVQLAKVVNSDQILAVGEVILQIDPA
jgi:hypothetical protein